MIELHLCKHLPLFVWYCQVYSASKLKCSPPRVTTQVSMGRVNSLVGSNSFKNYWWWVGLSQLTSSMKESHWNAYVVLQSENISNPSHERWTPTQWTGFLLCAAIFVVNMSRIGLEALSCQIKQNVGHWWCQRLWHAACVSCSSCKCSVITVPWITFRVMGSRLL